MGIKQLKLFHYPATRSARVKWILHETVGENFEVEVVELYKGQQYSAAYMQKNPNHCVPTLEITMDDGESVYMSESAAMVSLLADAFPDKKLAPPANVFSLARADYLQMLHFGSSPMDMMLWQIRIHEHIMSDEERDLRVIARYRKKFIDEVEPQLAARLEESDFICGDQFTAADCVIGHNVTWARAYGLCQAAVFGGYVSKLFKRPAFASAFADAADFSVKPPADSGIGRTGTRYSG